MTNEKKYVVCPGRSVLLDRHYLENEILPTIEDKLCEEFLNSGFVKVLETEKNEESATIEDLPKSFTKYNFKKSALKNKPLAYLKDLIVEIDQNIDIKSITTKEKAIALLSKDR